MARYEIVKTSRGTYRWRLVLPAGDVVECAAKAYATAAGARRGIDAHRRAACTDRVVDLTGSRGGIGGPGEE